MSTAIKRGHLAALAVFATALAAACATKPVNGLEIVISTDLAPTAYNDIKLEISELPSGGSATKLWDRDYEVPMEATLPTAFTLLAGQTPDEVLIAVTAYDAALSPVVQRVVQVQVPTDRLAVLYMVLAERCAGQVTMIGAEGEPVSTCTTPGQSCQPDTGMCGSNNISTPLPTYMPGQGLDAGPSLGDAAPLVEAGEPDAPGMDATLPEASDAPSPGMGFGSDAGSADTGDAPIGSPVTLVCTGAEEAFVVPEGASAVQVWAWGAGGGGYIGSGLQLAAAGGGGAFAGQTFTVHPGDTWKVRVGCAGTNAVGRGPGPNDGGWGFCLGGASQAANGASGWLGGSGGGASALLYGTTTMLVAGAGGGGGGGVGDAFGGGGGSDGKAGGTCSVPNGGGGGEPGRSGENGGLGGAGYDGGGLPGQSGTAMSGGNGGTVFLGDGLGGGGGGGYVGGGGGGGGGNCYGGGGGGGGGSYINTLNAVSTPVMMAATIGSQQANSSDSHLPLGFAAGGVGQAKPGDGVIVIEWQ